jgi:hypothetical protein
MTISNHQLMHIVIILMFVIIFIYNNTSKHPLKPLSWNYICVIFILNALINIYRTYKKENQGKVI